MSDLSINMIEEDIKNSAWWERASRIPDRHYLDSQDVMLSDHLLSVRDNCLNLLSDPGSEYELEIHIAIENCGILQ